MTIRIVTDSTCDLPPDTVAAHAITVIPLYIHIGQESYLDGVDLTREAFYRNLPYYDYSPTTASSAPDVFRETYERLIDQGATGILSIHISANLSNTVNAAAVGARDVDPAKAAKAPIHVMDSRQLSLGVGFAAETAAKGAERGLGMAELVALASEQIQRTQVFAALGTMEYLRRSGRVSRVVAYLGNALQIKPIMRMYNGEAGAERVRTWGHARARIRALLERSRPLERAALVHTHCAERAEELRELCADLLQGLEVPSIDITPAIGAHIGPGAAGFACVSGTT